MVKKLQKEFISYCNNQELEVNSNQIEIVHRLEKYYQENFKTYFLKLFSKKSSKKGFYSVMDNIIKTGSKIAINISEKI